MVYISLLRGINVGGTGILPMKELVSICSGLGFESVGTYIQSGNVVFESTLSEARIRGLLEAALAEKMRKKIEVMVRTRDQLRAVLEANPFAAKEAAKTAVAFLHEPVCDDLIQKVVAPAAEQVRAGRREIYIYYPDGMGRSKLKLPLSGAATTIRNINTVTKLAAMAEELYRVR